MGNQACHATRHGVVATILTRNGVPLDPATFMITRYACHIPQSDSKRSRLIDGSKENTT
jgi:hypothetical protein